MIQECSQKTLRGVRRRRSNGFTLVELLTVLVVIALLAAIITPRYLAARDNSTFTACSQNLKNVATALQTYANDNSQTYPSSLSQLTPQYLALLPSCPTAAGPDTYSPSYESATQPPNFTVFCQGSYHIAVSGITSDQPYYYFGEGLGPKR